MGFLSWLLRPFRACFDEPDVRFCNEFAYAKLDCDGGWSPEGNPLPAVLHKLISKSDLGPGRLIVVGDVHGCLNELFQLLDTLDFKYGYDNLLLTGDLVNKGPHSQEVVAALRALSESRQVWTVRGNNDDVALAAWYKLQAGVPLEELKAKTRWVGQLLPEDVDYMNQMPFSIKVEGYNLVVVHAGVLPGVPLQQQQLATLTTMRDIAEAADGSLVALERATETSVPWAGCWQGPEHVVFGHDSERRLQGYDFCTGLDTACVAGGQLTACVLPPLSQLQQEPGLVRARSHNAPASLRDMGGFLLSVPSGTRYQG